MPPSRALIEAVKREFDSESSSWPRPPARVLKSSLGGRVAARASCTGAGGPNHQATSPLTKAPRGAVQGSTGQSIDRGGSVPDSPPDRRGVWAATQGRGRRRDPASRTGSCRAGQQVDANRQRLQRGAGGLLLAMVRFVENQCRAIPPAAERSPLAASSPRRPSAGRPAPGPANPRH